MQAYTVGELVWTLLPSTGDRVLLLTTQSLSHSDLMNTLLFFVLWNAISVHLIFESNSCLTLYVVSVGEQRVRQWGRNALLKEWRGEFVEVCPSQSSKVTADFIVEPLIWTRLGVLRFWKGAQTLDDDTHCGVYGKPLYWILLALIVIRDIGRVFFDLIVYWRL